ncbi:MULTISPECIES: RadC family protein [Myroides]|uniref:DNA repair protein RadC n=1 Tax=Myroides albus TaxID=2562892 RepID=A0A6I3LHL3_9FLAO|nr:MULTISPECIES: DNA repair protein RadC [Myroides]MTG97327.1 DNA repair protein RadC [Myroides albus]MVX34297.1 DNA repair protein RadC [Myroides sp. LoEW2-1]UVD80586.1 DNA repair protein RadC [Myroides albus]
MEQTNFTIKHWAEDDRPREKLILKGKASLSDAELLAILIGSGSKQETAVELSKRLLQFYSNNLALLARQGVKQLTTFKGIGEAKAVSIIAALEIGQRRRSADQLTQDQITCSQDVFEIMQPVLGDLDHEEFWVLLLSNSNKVNHKLSLSKGGMTGTVVDVRILFKSALDYRATGLILVHNHPSGKLKPSEADIAITKKIKEGGKIMDISLLDHVIITEHSYYSFADEGLM